METEKTLIPLSMLNAYVYCPRRFYYEFVQGEWDDSEDTEIGNIKHQRIESLEGKKRKEKETDKWRNIYLSSEKLGLIGKIDLVEECEGKIYPVEYKKRKTPKSENDEIFVYDNDKIQLYASALLIKNNNLGNPDRGFIYFVESKQRVEVIFNTDIENLAKKAIDEAKRISETQNIPPPLGENDPKCDKCSLVNICLPEESYYLKSKNKFSKDNIRLIIPSSPEEGILYVQNQGTYISKKGDTLEIINKNNDESYSIPIIQVRQLILYGNIQISSQAVSFLMENDIPVFYLSHYGKFHGTSIGIPSSNILLRIAQYNKFINEMFSLKAAKSFIKAKINNQRILIMRYAKTDYSDNEISDNQPNNNITTQSRFSAAIEKLSQLIKEIDDVQSFQHLLGIEGIAAKEYFNLFPQIIKSTDNITFSFLNRNRRPPTDPVNALLSFSYAILLKDCFSACLIVGLDPYLGFLHRPKHGRPALALDIMEEFRPIIADSVVLTLINNKIINKHDFLQTPTACYLNEKGRKKFFEVYERRMNDKIQHPIFKYTISYIRIIETQVRLLAKFIIDEIDFYEGFKVR